MFEFLRGGSAGKANPFSDILGSLGSGFGAGASSGLLDKIFGSDPAKDALNMMNTLYPGTTPYERLTAGGGGAANAGAVEEQSKRQSRTAMTVAKIGANAQRDVAKIQAGVGTRAQDLQYGLQENPKVTADIAALNSQEKLQLAQRLTELEKARATGAEADIQQARAAVRDFLVAKELSSSSWANLIDNSAGKAGVMIGNVIKYIRDTVNPTSKVPTSVGRPITPHKKANPFAP